MPPLVASSAPDPEITPVSFSVPELLVSLTVRLSFLPMLMSAPVCEVWPLPARPAIEALPVTWMVWVDAPRVRVLLAPISRLPPVMVTVPEPRAVLLLATRAALLSMVVPPV
jgi:hypothetical protein